MWFQYPLVVAFKQAVCLLNIQLVMKGEQDYAVPFYVGIKVGPVVRVEHVLCFVRGQLHSKAQLYECVP